MALLKDVAEGNNEYNLASEIANHWKITQVADIQDALGNLFEALPDDNLTQWSKDNQNTSYTAQALTFGAMASGLDYAVKYQEKSIAKLADDLTEHHKACDDTEFWNTKAESLLERLAVNEHNLDALSQTLESVKHFYENSTGDVWKAYTPASKTPVVSATSLELAATLARLGRK